MALDEALKCIGLNPSSHRSRDHQSEYLRIEDALTLLNIMALLGPPVDPEERFANV